MSKTGYVKIASRLVTVARSCFLVRPEQGPGVDSSEVSEEICGSFAGSRGLYHADPLFAKYRTLKMGTSTGSSLDVLEL
jgi:hypothetical protein